LNLFLKPTSTLKAMRVTFLLKETTESFDGFERELYSHVPIKT